MLEIGQKAFVNYECRLKGAAVRVTGIGLDHGLVEVEMLAGGARALYSPGDLVPALEPGTPVAYAPDYLRRNGADAREYKRTGRVVKALEGTLVQVEWADGRGPSTMPTMQLVRR